MPFVPWLCRGAAASIALSVVACASPLEPGAARAAQGGGESAAETSVGGGGGVGDGGASTPVQDGGLDAAAEASSGGDATDGSDPGRIICGASVCDTTQGSRCCAQSNFHLCYPPTPEKCLGDYWYCDEAADCTYYDPSWICFVDRSATGFLFTCNGKGVGSSPQVCKTDAECVNGMACVAATCGGLAIRSCGPLPAGFCD